jgi:hypothetical protein
MTTEILPVGPSAPEPATEPAAVEAPKKRRRGWLIALIVVATLLILGVIAFIVGEGLAKDYARDYVRARIVKVLQLPEDAQVDVDLGGGSIIFQALAGRIETVDVEVPDVAFGQLTGDVVFHAEGVPLDETAPVDVLRVDFGIGADDLSALGDGQEGADAPTFLFEDDEISLTSEFDLLGVSIPLGLTFAPSAADGALVLTPTSLTIGTQTFAADTDDQSFLGQIARALLKPQTLCIASSVPQALVLADATIDEQNLVLRFEGDGVALGGPEFSTLGTCPE